MVWRSIDEGGSAAERSTNRSGPAAAATARAVVLRGVLVTGPDRPRRGLTIAGVAALLYTFMSWAGSVLTHLLPLIILMGVIVFGKREEEGFVSVGVSMRDAAPAQGDKNEGEQLRPEPPQLPDSVKPEPEPEPEPPPKPKEQPVAPSASTAPTEVKTPGEGAKPESTSIGTGASTGGAPSKPADSKDVDNDPTAAVRKARADDLETLKRGKKTDIVVVAGVYDRTEEVLTHLGVPHTVIDPPDLGDHDLSACAVLVIDCSNVYAQGAGVDADTISDLKTEVARLEKSVEKLQAQIVDGEKKNDSRVRRWRDELRTMSANLATKKRILAALIDTDAIAVKLREFVGRGGYLFTSDWGLTLVEKAFKGSIKVGGYVGPRTVKINAKAGQEKHPLLREVFNVAARGSTTTMRQLRWVIDGSSYMIRTTSPHIDVLVETPEINSQRSIVVTFRHDGEKLLAPASREPGGRVLHMLSHFADQADKAGDYALQNMLINFLVERLNAAK